MVWVLEHEEQTSGVTRLVLLALANYADENGECWPGVPRLAANCRCSERQVQRALAELVAMGIITRDVQGATDSRIAANKRPNRYVIQLSPGVTPCHPKQVQGRHPRRLGVTSAPFRGDTVVTQTVIDPSMNRAAVAQVREQLTANRVQAVGSDA